MWLIYARKKVSNKTGRDILCSIFWESDFLLQCWIDISANQLIETDSTVSFFDGTKLYRG